MNLQTPTQIDMQAEAAANTTDARAIVHRTRGSAHGPIVRLASPGDLGQFIKPFVFLDFFKFSPSASPSFGMHPHSGIATLTYLIQGETTYEDTTGQEGVLPCGGFEWMRAGNGVWHTGVPKADKPGMGFQLWVALPASEENAPAQSIYLAPEQIPQEGPARVLIGQYGQAKSAIPAPSDMSYLVVELKDGEQWRYTPPASHDVAWIAVGVGMVNAGELVDISQLAIFEESNQAIDITAHGDSVFVLGSAAKHPHDLVTGYYSVHTSKVTLAQGEAEIRRIGEELRSQGRL